MATSQRAKAGDMTKPALDESHHDFKKSMKELTERLAFKIPLSKLNIEQLGLNNSCNDAKAPHKHVSNESAPEGIADDKEYSYIYETLLIETQEWYHTIDQFVQYINGTAPKDAPKAQQAKQKPPDPKAKKTAKDGAAGKEEDNLLKEQVYQRRCAKLLETMDTKSKLQSFSVLNFSSNENLAEFLVFLKKYMKFTEEQIYFTILIGDLVEQSIRQSNLDEFERNLNIDKKLEKIHNDEAAAQKAKTERKMNAKHSNKPTLGGSRLGANATKGNLMGALSKGLASGLLGNLLQQKNNNNVKFPAPEESEEEESDEEDAFKVYESINKTYKFMTIDQLEVFKRQYIKSVNQLILRMYKSIFAIFMLYPELNDFSSPEHSLFDKMYQMQLINHCFAQSNQDNINELIKMELPVPLNFEKDIETLLGGLGIKHKPMHVIQDVSRIIKNKINDALEQLFCNNQLTPEFFITSSSLKTIWKENILCNFDSEHRFQFKTGLDVVKMAFQKHFGGNKKGALTCDSFKFFSSFLPTYEEALSSYEYIALIDMVNFTDFIDMNKVLSLFQQDQIPFLLQKLQSEKTIVQELLNQNYFFQTPQNNGNFVTSGCYKFKTDYNMQLQNLKEIDKNLNQASKKASSNQAKTVFIRTTRRVEENQDFQLLYFLNLFGLKNILNDELDYAKHMDEVIEKDEEKLFDFYVKYENEVGKERQDAVPQEQESDEEEGLERSEGGEGVEGKDSAQAAPPAANALLGLLNAKTLNGGAMNGKLQSKTVDNGIAGIKSNATAAPGQDTKSFLKSLSPTPMTPLKNPDAGQSQQLPHGIMSQEQESNLDQHLGSKQEVVSDSARDEIKDNKSSKHQPSEMSNMPSARNLQAIKNKHKEGVDCYGKMDSTFLKDLSYDDCGLISLNHLLAVNQDQDIAFTPMEQAQQALKRFDHGVQNILGGSQEKAISKFRRTKAKEIGNTFGNYSKVVEPEQFRTYQMKDKGYLIMFESENEAKFMTNNGFFQRFMWKSNLLQNDKNAALILSERFENLPADDGKGGMKKQATSSNKYDEFGFENNDIMKAALPIFLPFSELRKESEGEQPEHFSKICEYHVFYDMHMLLEKPKVNKFLKYYKDPIYCNMEKVAPDLKMPDLNTLKNHAINMQQLHFIRLEEIHFDNLHSKMRVAICKRFYEISQKLSAISQDGFTRERFIMKIKDSAEKVQQALGDLVNEEQAVESGYYQNSEQQDLTQAIARITDLMLKIEELNNEKVLMEQTLLENEQKWIAKDMIFKRRRIILNYIIKTNLEVNYDSHAMNSIYQMQEQKHNLGTRAYELIFFMIHHIFKQNRMPSINFMAEINQYMMSQMEERNQLNHTLNELVTKKSTIEEEKRQMKKQIKEMTQLCDLKEQKDALNKAIGDQEVKINTIKKTLSQQKGQEMTK